MPIHTTIDKERNITVHTATGNLTYEELVQTLESFYRNTDAPENVLWDGRQASLVNLTAGQLQQLATYTKKIQREGLAVKGGRRALLAPASVDYGLARMIGSFKDLLAEDIKFEVRTFRTYQEAIDWLTKPVDGLPRHDDQPVR
ncbi:MAG: hypothetical protein HRF44_01160 [Ignavibacterium sp.]|jgi:hypothetical protein